MSSEKLISIWPLHWPSDSVYEYSVLMSDSGDRAVIFAVSCGHFNEEQARPLELLKAIWRAGIWDRKSS